MYKDFGKFGKELFLQALNNSHSGNMSVRKENTIHITRTGARLGDIEYSDIVRVNLKDDKRDVGASVEVKVHRAIYLANPDVSAIVHAHPTHAIVISLLTDKIIPIDQEGPYYFKQVPVLIECEETIGSSCVEFNLPKYFKDNKIVVIKGHGAFAVGKNLEEAAKLISVLESSCKIIYLLKMQVGK